MEERAWDATSRVMADQLDEVEAAHTAFKILQSAAHREWDKVYESALHGLIEAAYKNKYEKPATEREDA
jgi:hypothetical protein